MKSSSRRVLLGGFALVAGGLVAWRVGTSAMTSYSWSTSFARGQKLLKEGSIAEATSALESACFAMQKLGPEHPRYDETRTALADAYEASGRFDDAYPLYLESLTRAREIHGSDSPEVAASLYELGRIRHLQGQNEAAVGLFRQAMIIWQNIHGNEHPDLIPTLTRLGLALRDAGQSAEAAQYLEWAIGLQRRESGSDSPQVAALEEAYAGVLDSLDKKELASQFRNHAHSITGSSPPAEPTPADSGSLEAAPAD